MAKKSRNGARSKLRKHFLANIGKVMGTGELRKVAGGITERARGGGGIRGEERGSKHPPQTTHPL